jgi:hypothetical protein
VKADGVSALSIWPVTVTVAGQAYTIPPLPAHRWMIAVARGSWMDIFPGLLDDPDCRVDDLLLDGLISAGACEKAAKDALAAATGMPWWSARKLIVSTINNPAITGALILSGVRFDQVGIGAVAHAAYRVFSKGADSKQLARLDREIQEPPRDMSIAERAATSGSGFEQMMAQRGATS